MCYGELMLVENAAQIISYALLSASLLGLGFDLYGLGRYFNRKTFCKTRTELAKKLNSINEEIVIFESKYQPNQCTLEARSELDLALAEYVTNFEKIPSFHKCKKLDAYPLKEGISSHIRSSESALREAEWRHEKITKSRKAFREKQSQFGPRLTQLDEDLTFAEIYYEGTREFDKAKQALYDAFRLYLDHFAQEPVLDTDEYISFYGSGGEVERAINKAASLIGMLSQPRMDHCYDGNHSGMREYRAIV